jgi:hypothetical protein
MSDWDNLVELTRDALETLLWEGDKMTDRIEELEAKLEAERERIISVYRKLSTGSTVGAGDGGTLVVQYVDPEQFAAAIRKGGE